MAAVEARLNGAPAPASSQDNAATPTDTFADEKLDSDWADKAITRELPRWKGEPMMGRRYSDAPAEWHDSASGFYEFKARKGREENPVRVKANGKPWHEGDSFTAKLHRTWAKRIRARGNASPAQPAVSSDEASVWADEPIDGVPF